MARFTPISTQAADSRFAPSPFMPSPISGPTTEEINRAASQGMYAPGSFGAINAAANGTGGGAPAGPATAANPLGTLNRILGLNLGNPTENMATRQATDALPSGARVAGALGEQDDQRKAAQFAQAMKDRGGLPDVNRPDYEVQRKVAQHMFDTIYGTPQPNSFIPQSTTSYAPTGLRDRAIAAGGQEVQGAGGAMVSATKNAQGGNSFMLRQGTPQSQFLPPAIGGDDSMPQNVAASPSQPVANQQSPNGDSSLQQSQGAGQGMTAPSAFDQAKKTYNDTLSAALNPKSMAPGDAAAAKDALAGAKAVPAAADDANTPAGAISQAKGALTNAQESYDRYMHTVSKPDMAVEKRLSQSIADAKKNVDSVNQHNTLRSIINENYGGLETNIGDAIKLIDKGGATGVWASKMPDVLAQGRENLRAKIHSIASGAMMGAIDMLKNTTGTGSTGIGRILQTEANALSSQYAALKDEHNDVLKQDGAQLKSGLQNLWYHSARLNLASKGIDPDSRTFANEAAVKAAAKAGKVKAGDDVIIGKRVATWSD